ncbi:MAG: hypothetical protein HQL50_10885, partial [Magnetococcales bacterium]|nr:hypothetical protein [Magnetococcales bacterium]
MKRSLTLGRKLILVVAGLVFVVLLIQVSLSSLMVIQELDKNTKARLTIAGLAQSAFLKQQIKETGKDIEIMIAHSDLENAFTQLAFDDLNGLTRSAATLERFFSRIHRGKPRYRTIQVAPIKGRPILELRDGSTTHRYSALDTGEAVRYMTDTQAEIAHRAVQTGGWSLHSTALISHKGKPEGALWIVQSLDGTLTKTMANIEALDLHGVIVTTDGGVVARTKGLDDSTTQMLLTGSEEGWSQVSATLPALGWQLVLATHTSEAWGVVQRLVLAGAVSAFLLVIVLGFYIRSAIVRRLKGILRIINNMAEGKLTT